MKSPRLPRYLGGDIPSYLDNLALRIEQQLGPAFLDDARNVVLSGLNASVAATVTASDTVLSGLGKLQAQTNASIRSVKSFGALGDDVTDDTGAFAAAGDPVLLISGKYKTTIASNAFNALHFGWSGQIRDAAGHTRGKIFSTLQAAPSAGTSNIYSAETIFDGDYSRVPLAIEHRIYGTNTLGTPTTGYSVTPQAWPLVGYVLNHSGHMQDNATGDGQTGVGFGFINCEHHGQGNMCALAVFGQSYGTNPSATTFLAYPSIGLLAGQVTAGGTGTYLNPVEIHTVDNGYDSAAINYVATQIRSNGTGANGANWIGYLSQNQGSFYSDAVLSAQGNYRYGLDLSATTLLTQGALVLASGHRIYYGASNTSGLPTGTAQGQVYSTHVGGFLAHVNGTGTFSIGTAGCNSNVPLTVTGEIAPTADNAYQLGDATHRWSAVWSATGTIQTSDPSLKGDIAPISTALPLVTSIAPVTYRWLDGGSDEVEVEEEQLVRVTEPAEVEVEEVEMRDGTPVLVKRTVMQERPAYDHVGVVDEAGQPVMVNVAGKHGPVKMEQRVHAVPRLERRRVTVKTRLSRPGRRTHWGFLASDVRDAFNARGLDFAGYVKDEHGVEHLRPDQLVPVLWRAVQELAERVAELEQR